MNAIDLISLRGGRRTPVMRQAEAAECGLACLAMVASYHGYNVDLATLRRKFSISLKGATLKTLMKIADDLGLNARALRGEPQDLADVPLPAVLHWNLSHFVVLTDVSRRMSKLQYKIHDPAHGELTISREELSQHFTGVLLELTPSERFQRKTEVATLQLSQLWSKATGLKRALVQVGLLSLVLQLVALATPFYMQTAIDSALPSFDNDLLAVLAAGFAGLVLVQLATGWLRAWVLLGLGTTLGYQVVVNLFRHLMRLPLPWFERRHVGDVISRSGSTQPIVTMLTQGLMAAVLDGVLGIATLVLMIAYSSKLAGIAVVALLLYLGMRLTFLRTLKALNVSLITANASEQSSLIESVRGILGVKTFGQETNRQRIWQNKKAEAVNAQIKVGRVSAGFDAVQTAILGLENVLFVYLAIGMAMHAEMTVGMLFAYQAYKQQFLGAGTRLIQAMLDWRINSVHLARIADIALSPPEAGAIGTGVERSPLIGKIELRAVRFRYGAGEPEVLKGINLVVDAGETLIITGPSGGGKTTLIKIMLGLLDPTAGEVLVDDIPLSTYGKAAFRSQVGAVMQDDLLYAGSIAENIALFDPELNMGRVREVTVQAAIAEEIEHMPMGFDSLVGDMGSSLSGGQRQRVLVARAFYPRPKYIFADEITASLDSQNHSLVANSLARVAATKVIITHRTLGNIGGRLILVANGVLSEIGVMHEGTTDKS